MLPHPEPDTRPDQRPEGLTPYQRQRQADIDRWVDQDDRVAIELRKILLEARRLVRALPDTCAEMSPHYTRREMEMLLTEMMPEPNMTARRNRLRGEIELAKGE